ncbi:MAG: sugar transferase [Lachnospiraceae bacterium]|nr:sugar transferase [Lachnospiraceae bacterium]
MYYKKNQLMELAVCLADLLITCFSFLVAGMLRYERFFGFKNSENLRETLIILVVFHFATYYFLKVYDDFFKRGRYSELILSVKYNLIMVAGVTLFAFGMKRELFRSRMVVGIFFVLNTFLIWALHLMIRNSFRLFRSTERQQVNLLLVTTCERLEKTAENFYKSKETIWNIVGAVLLDEAPENYSGDIPLVGCQEKEYLDFTTQNVVDEVFIQVDEIQKREKFLKKMILEFETMGIVVNLNMDLFNLGVTGEKRIYTLENYHVVAFTSRMFDYRMVLLKRLIDIVGALVGLLITFIVGVILAPFLLLESPGPLIFSQQRVGVNGRVFRFYKFRSMYVDAEKRKAELAEQNEMSGPMFKIDHDPRITKVGAFIRRTSIDELPQFWNVLKGDMSLVGTRPPTLDEYQQYNYYQKRRISFRPGLTGLWQVSGRSDITNFDDVVKMDLEYIDNWSLVLDLKIILKTVYIVLKGSGAK